MVFSESTNWHEAIAPSQEIGKAERQLDAAISNMVGGGSSSSGLQVVYISTSTGVVQASTSEGSILGSTGVGSLDLPADFFAEGVVLRITARGYYSALDGTDNLNLRIELEGDLMVATGNFTPPTSANKYWEISGLIVCRSAGETGTVMPSAHFSYDEGAGEGMVTTTLRTIDTTAALTFDITAQWDTSDPDNSISCTQLVLEKMQVGNASLSPADVGMEFDTASSNGTRNAETHSVNVVLRMPAGSQLASAASINWSATNVESPTSGSVTFPPGSDNGDTQAIELILDYSAGNPVVTLSSPSSNATLGAVDEHAVTILWRHTFQFDEASGSDPHTSYGNGGWTQALTNRGVHTSGVGWEDQLASSGSDRLRSIQIDRVFSSSALSRVYCLYDASSGSSNLSNRTHSIYRGLPTFAVLDQVANPGQYGSDQELEWTGTDTISGLTFDIRVMSRDDSTDGGGSCTLKQAEVEGSGAEPF